MSIRFLSILFLLIVAGSRLSAQPTYSNINLFSIAEQGRKQLSAGDYEGAIATFNSYKLLIAKPASSVGPLDEYAKKADEIRKIVIAANKKFDSRNYGEALQEYKKYREVIKNFGENVIILPVEAKINECISVIQARLKATIKEKDKEITRKDAEIATLEKQILGFEYIFKGDDVLRQAKNESAFEIAKDLFTKARDLKSGHPDVERESVNRIALCNEIIYLMQEYRKANTTGKLAILEKYKAIDNFKNIVFEKEIAFWDLKIPKPSSTTTAKEIEETLKKYANECALNDLATYIEQVPDIYTHKIPIKAGVESLIVQLKDIETFNITGDPEQQIRYAKGGYDILLEDKMITSMPVIGQIITNCIRNKYFPYLVTHAKEIDDKGQDLRNAKIYAIEAHKQAIGDSQKQEADKLLRGLNQKIGCSIIKSDLNMKLKVIDLKLKACRLEEASKLFENITLEGVGCEVSIEEETTRIKETTEKYKQYAGARIELKRIDSVARNFLISNNCQAAKDEFKLLPKLLGCDSTEIKKVYDSGMTLSDACIDRNCYTTNLAIGQNNEDKKDYKSAKVSYQAAANCAKDEQRSAMNAKIFEMDRKLAVLAAEEEKNKKSKKSKDHDKSKKPDEFKEPEDSRKKEKENDSTFTDNLIPEFSAGIYLLKPSIKTGSETKILTSQTVNFDIGVNINVLKRKITPLTGLMVGLHYNKNAFTTVNTDSKDTESFDFDILNLSLGTKMPVHIHQKKKAREYIRFEANALFPFKVKYHNYFNDYAYDSGISFFKKTEFTSMAAFGGTVGGGHEFQKGKARLGIEAFVKFNFNLLALNPSDAGVRSPSSISSFLLGYGLKTTFRIGK